MRHGSFPVAVVIGVLLGTAAFAQDAGFTTTWSKAGDLAGFESPHGKLIHVADGGNPGGFLRTVKTTTILPKPYLRTSPTTSGASRARLLPCCSTTVP
jgi:hypothetical protein